MPNLARHESLDPESAELPAFLPPGIISIPGYRVTGDGTEFTDYRRAEQRAKALRSGGVPPLTDAEHIEILREALRNQGAESARQLDALHKAERDVKDLKERVRALEMGRAA